MQSIRYGAISFISLFIPILAWGETVGVFFDPKMDQIKFAANDVQSALEKIGIKAEMLDIASLDASYPQKKVVTASEFAEADAAPGSSLGSIANSAAGKLDGKMSTDALAPEMEAGAMSSLSIVKTMSASADAETGMASGNIRSMSYLSLYYANKITNFHTSSAVCMPTWHELYTSLPPPSSGVYEKGNKPTGSFLNVNNYPGELGYAVRNLHGRAGLRSTV